MTRDCLKKKPAGTVAIARPSPRIIELDDEDDNQGKADA